LDWIGLDWIGLDWIGLDWIGLDCIGMGGVCARLGKAKPPKIVQSLAPQTFGIAYEGFIFGQAIFLY